MPDKLDELRHYAYVLRKVAETYPTASIQNAIVQIESRIKQMEKKQ